MAKEERGDLKKINEKDCITFNYDDYMDLRNKIEEIDNDTIELSKTKYWDDSTSYRAKLNEEKRKSYFYEEYINRFHKDDYNRWKDRIDREEDMIEYKKREKRRSNSLNRYGVDDLFREYRAKQEEERIRQRMRESREEKAMEEEARRLGHDVDWWKRYKRHNKQVEIERERDKKIKDIILEHFPYNMIKDLYQETKRDKEHK